MNTDKVLELARKVGFNDWYVRCNSVEFIKFATLLQQQMIKDGWRQCAKGQGTSQFCAMAEQALAKLEEK